MRGNLAPQKERWAFSGIYYGSLHTNVQNIQCYNFQEGDRAGREGKTTTMNSPQLQAVTFQMSASRWKEPQVRMRNTEELNTKLWREGEKNPNSYLGSKKKTQQFCYSLGGRQHLPYAVASITQGDKPCGVQVALSVQFRWWRFLALIWLCPRAC